MNIMKETTERMLYRMKCKHYVEGSGGCVLNSLQPRCKYGWHFLARCTGDCRRMKNYDKKIKEE